MGHQQGKHRWSEPPAAPNGQHRLASITAVNTFAAILWDMDGTLVDSEPLWAQATYAMSEQMGRRLTPELQATTMGGSVFSTVDICAAHAGLEHTDYEYWRGVLFAHVSKLFATDLTLRPGVSAMLATMHAAAVPMAIATNTERVVAQPAIDHIGNQWFQATVCGDEVPTPKPSPDVYLRAAELLEVPIQRCLVFEDSLNGMRAGLASGATVVGITTTVREVPRGVIDIRDLVGDVAFTEVADQPLDWWHRRIRQLGARHSGSVRTTTPPSPPRP